MKLGMILRGRGMFETWLTASCVALGLSPSAWTEMSFEEFAVLHASARRLGMS